MKPRNTPGLRSGPIKNSFHKRMFQSLASDVSGGGKRNHVTALGRWMSMSYKRQRDIIGHKWDTLTHNAVVIVCNAILLPLEGSAAKSAVMTRPYITP